MATIPGSPPGTRRHQWGRGGHRHRAWDRAFGVRGRSVPGSGVCTRFGGLHPVRGRNRLVCGAGLHPVRGFAPRAGAESAESGVRATVPGANPHAGCTVAAPEALSAPVPGANPRNGCRVASGAPVSPRRVRRHQPEGQLRPRQMSREASTPRGPPPTPGRRPKQSTVDRWEPGCPDGVPAIVAITAGFRWCPHEPAEGTWRGKPLCPDGQRKPRRSTPPQRNAGKADGHRVLSAAAGRPGARRRRRAARGGCHRPARLLRCRALRGRAVATDRRRRRLPRP